MILNSGYFVLPSLEIVSNSTRLLFDLVFTLGILAPLLIAIGQGLPIDCVDMETSLLKELKTK